MNDLHAQLAPLYARLNTLNAEATVLCEQIEAIIGVRPPPPELISSPKRSASLVARKKKSKGWVYRGMTEAIRALALETQEFTARDVLRHLGIKATRRAMMCSIGRMAAMANTGELVRVARGRYSIGPKLKAPK